MPMAGRLSLTTSALTSYLATSCLVGRRTCHRPRVAPGPEQVPQVIPMRHSLTDLIAHADQLADTFESFEPAPEDFGAPLPPLMAVKLAAFRRAAAEKELAEAIRAGREARLS